MKGWFDIVMTGWKSKSRYDVVTMVAGIAMGAILFVDLFGQSIWHWTSSAVDNVAVASTAAGICMLSIALAGFMLWPSIDRSKRGLSIMFLGYGVAMISQITSLDMDPARPTSSRGFASAQAP